MRNKGCYIMGAMRAFHEQGAFAPSTGQCMSGHDG
jgi:hypothetical protein